MATQLTEEQHQQLLTRATLRGMQSKKALIPDFFDLRNQLWKELPNQPYDSNYAKPWVLDYFEGDSGSQGLSGAGLLGNAIALAASLTRTPNPYAVVGGGVVGVLAGGMTLYRDHASQEREQLGRRLWNDDFNLVSTMVSNTWIVERALVDIVNTPGGNQQMREAAAAGLARLAQWRLDNDLPTQSTPLQQLLLTGGPLDASIDKAAAHVATKHNPVEDPEKFNKTLLAELKSLVVNPEDLKDLLQPLADDLKQRAKAQMEAQEEAAFESRMTEFVATGQVIGLVIGLQNARAGQAVQTIFEQSAVLYKSFRAIHSAIDAGSAIAMASVASGFGAVLAIAGAMSMFGGGGNGPSPTEAIMSAIQTVMEGLNKIGEKIEQLSIEVREFSVRADVSFASVDKGVARLSDQIVKLESTINAIKLEDIEGDLFEVVRDFRTTGTAEAAFALLKKAYSIAIYDASRETQTSDLESPSRLASMVWSLADSNRYFPHWTDAGVALNGGPALLLTALERYPSMLSRAADWFLAGDPSRTALFGDTLSVSSGMEDELSTETLAARRSVNPFIATSALGAALEAARMILLRPDLGQDPYPHADLQPNEMLRDVVRLIQWPYRVVSALNAQEVQSQARRAYLRSVEALIGWVMQARMSSTDLLSSWSPVSRYSMLIGAERLVREKWNSFSYRLSFERGGHLPGIPSDRGVPDEGAEIWDDDDLDAANTALQILVAAGCTLKLSSIRAWVDQPFAGQPEWFGSGDFHETFSVSASFAPGTEMLVLYLYVVDTGSASVYDGSFYHPVDAIGLGDDKIYLDEYTAGRGRTTRMWEDQPDTGQVNWAPFSDLAYSVLSGWLEAVNADAAGSGFTGTREWLRNQDVSLKVFVAGVDVFQLALSKVRECVNDDVAASPAGKLTIPPALIEACSTAWLNMTTVELALVEGGHGRVAPLLSRVMSTPAIVRGDAELLAAVFGVEKIQGSFWGDSAASMIDFLQQDRGLGLRLLSLEKGDFDKLLKDEKNNPTLTQKHLTEEHSACICEATLRLHIPYFPNDDRVGTPSETAATCLPLTHRAIAASNGFSILATQVSGWE